MLHLLFQLPPSFINRENRRCLVQSSRGVRPVSQGFLELSRVATPVAPITHDQGWVSIGIDHDTAYFATRAIRCWWDDMGQRRFPRAHELLITADGGGSNSSRSRLWKVALQDLADTIGLKLRVCHFPPGTSKWNKIEHRLFSFITQNWRGRPLVSRQVVVNLIASTTTKTGLTVRAALDTHKYETGLKVSDEEMAQLKLTPADFHGNWNYTIAPRRRST
jgi:Rhodopirellula transposase DDE domain